MIERNVPAMTEAALILAKVSVALKAGSKYEARKEAYEQ